MKSVAFTGTETIGGIVASLPRASKLMKAYKIDYCCGGNRPLSAVLHDHRIDQWDFLLQLNQIREEASASAGQYADWRPAASSELIDHIVDTHHAYLLNELPLLSEFVTKLLRVHRQAHPELAKLHTLFHRLKMELEQHLITEEVMVFPLIRKAEQTGSGEDIAKAAATIDELEADHSAVGGLLREIRELTADYTLPADACRTYALTYQMFEEMEADIFEHVHKENNVLFPRLARK